MRSALLRRVGISLASVLLMAAADDNAPGVLVQTVPLQQGSLPQVLMAYGTVQADPSAHETLMAPLAASVGEIYVRTGEAVAPGAALVLLVPSPQSSAAYAQASSALQLASDSVRRSRALLGEHLATAQQLADAETAQSDARAALVALRAQGADGPTTLRAPFQAIITAVTASARALVTEGTPLLELARPSGLALLVGVVPDQIAAIAAGDPATITPLGAGRSYASRVVSRGAAVDAGTGLVPVQLSLPAAGLLAGESAAAAITTGRVRGYIVPHAAILVDGNGDTYVVQAVGGAARIVHVRVLDAAADRDAIDGPLDSSAPLILAGNYQLQDGMKVRLSEPAAQRGP